MIIKMGIETNCSCSIERTYWRLLVGVQRIMGVVYYNSELALVRQLFKNSLIEVKIKLLWLKEEEEVPYERLWVMDNIDFPAVYDIPNNFCIIAGQGFLTGCIKLIYEYYDIAIMLQFEDFSISHKFGVQWSTTGLA